MFFSYLVPFQVNFHPIFKGPLHFPIFIFSLNFTPNFSSSVVAEQKLPRRFAHPLWPMVLVFLRPAPSSVAMEGSRPPFLEVQRSGIFFEVTIWIVIGKGMIFETFFRIIPAVLEIRSFLSAHEGIGRLKCLVLQRRLQSFRIKGTLLRWLKGSRLRRWLEEELSRLQMRRLRKFKSWLQSLGLQVQMAPIFTQIVSSIFSLKYPFLGRGNFTALSNPAFPLVGTFCSCCRAEGKSVLPFTGCGFGEVKLWLRGRLPDYFSAVSFTSKPWTWLVPFGICKIKEKQIKVQSS